MDKTQFKILEIAPGRGNMEDHDLKNVFANPMNFL
jgi:hypothetical protein